MNQPQLSCCPHCHSETGYYFKTQLRGTTETNYTFDGEFDVENNGHLHDSLRYYDGKWTYCRSCHKRLFKEEME